MEKKEINVDISFAVRRFAAITVGLLVSLGVGAQKWNQTYQNYIDKYKDLAISQMQRYGIPASITLAQGVYESGAGTSMLATTANNHFGIKCHGWTGRSVEKNDGTNETCWRAYDSVSESYEDHSKFLAGNSRYASLFDYSSTDYKSWAKGLKACGYATSSDYPNKLIAIIELYNLSQYDSPVSASYTPVANAGTSSSSKSSTSSSKHSSAATSKKASSGKSSKSASKRSDYKQNRQVAYRKSKSAVKVAPGQEHKIYHYNDNFYVYARKGDTFASIGEEMGVSAYNLARYNEIDQEYQLRAGDIVYLCRKQKRSIEAYKGKRHIITPGQSMWSISQLYGIRLASLYDINGLPLDYGAKAGDSLRLY